VARAGKLLRRYKEDGSACFAWGRVLERLLADPAQADEALQEAVKSNRFVALHVAGQKPLPKGMPAMYSLGSVEEAMVCQHWMGAAWKAHPEAVSWVSEHYAQQGRTSVPSKAALKKMKTHDAGAQ
jgi:hypothetical protein